MNLGCPQACARRGGYGAFLDDDGAARAVRAVAEASPLPATAKIRCRAAGDAEGLDVDVAATVALAERLVAAGAAAVCVHARTRAGKTFAEAAGRRAGGRRRGRRGRAGRANGGVRRAADAAALRRATGCAPSCRPRRCSRTPGSLRGAGAAARGRGVPRVPRPRRPRPSRGRAHVVAMLHAALARDADLREAVAAARTVAELAAALPDDAGPLRARDRAAPDAPATRRSWRGAGPSAAGRRTRRARTHRPRRGAASRGRRRRGSAAPSRGEPAALRLRRAGEARRVRSCCRVLRRGERRRRLREPRVAEEAAEDAACAVTGA